MTLKRDDESDTSPLLLQEGMSKDLVKEHRCGGYSSESPSIGDLRPEIQRLHPHSSINRLTASPLGQHCGYY